MPLVPPPRARRIAATEGAAPDDFVRTVAAALAHLHDPARLQTHPLAARLSAPGGSSDNFGRVLEQALRDAIQALQPAGRHRPEQAGRIHRLLHLRYIEGLQPSVVWTQLGIGKSEYYREHSRGIVAVASLVWERQAADARRDARNASVEVPSAHQLLPKPLTSFVGRGRELNELRALLQLARLVTLTGPPGTGKTRLALQAARDAKSELRTTAVFVGLAPVARPELTWPAVAQALRVKERSGRAPLDDIIEALAERELLLILDNFEHVIAAGPDLATLMHGCPEVRVLVTSRERLRISGEHAYAVSPLEEADGVELFIERARSTSADFVATDENVGIVTAICARVDYLPLAIELAAGRCRLFAPRALLARLERRLPLLCDGPRDYSPRQQTLSATIAWSYDLLNAAEQRLFHTLAVFVGGCSLEAIQALCGVDILDDLASLVEKSLVNRDAGINSEPRFWMLETLREYALDRLEESGITNEVRRAHAVYFRGFAERAEAGYFGPTEGACLDLLEQDYGNLHTAIEWTIGAGEIELGLTLAGALWRFFFHRDHLSAGRNLLSRLLSAAQNADDAVMTSALAKGRFAVSSLAVWQGDSPAGRDDAASSVALYRALGDKRGESYALHTLAHTAAEHNVGRDLYLASIDCAREAADPRAEVWSLQCLANVKIALGEVAEAQAVLTEALAVARRLDIPMSISGIVTGLGALAAQGGDHARAYELYVEAFDLRRKQGDRVVTDQLNKLGRAALDMGDLGLAATHFAESLELCRKQGIKFHAAFGLAGLAEVDMRAGNPREAAVLFAAADEVLDALDERRSTVDQAKHEGMLEAIVDMLGQPEFQQAAAAGRAMTREEAITRALVASDCLIDLLATGRGVGEDQGGSLLSTQR